MRFVPPWETLLRLFTACPPLPNGPGVNEKLFAECLVFDYGFRTFPTANLHPLPNGKKTVNFLPGLHGISPKCMNEYLTENCCVSRRLRYGVQGRQLGLNIDTAAWHGCRNVLLFAPFLLFSLLIVMAKKKREERDERKKRHNNSICLLSPSLSVFSLRRNVNRPCMLPQSSLEFAAASSPFLTSSKDEISRLSNSVPTAR